MAREAEATAGVWSPRHRALTLGIVLTVVLTAFEVLAVATVMPIVVRELGGVELYGWAFSAFFLGSLLGTVIVPAVLARRGLAAAFLGALALFAGGLALAGTAASMPILVGARVVQGLGGGALTPVAYVAIGRDLPEDLRPRLFATMSTAWVVPAVLGPAAAGLIGEVIGWRIVFLGLLPLVLVAALLTRAPLARLDAADAAAASAMAAGGEVSTGPPESQLRRIGLALVVTVGAALLTVGLGGRDPVFALGVEIPALIVVAAMVLGGLALIAFAFRRLTPPGTLRLARGLPAAILLRGLLTVGFYALDAYVALALIDWRGLPPAVAGIALAAGSIAWTLGSWTQARWALQLGYGFFVRLGFAILTLGIVGFAVGLDPRVPVIASFVAFALAGYGIGMAYAPQSLIVLREAPPDAQGASTSALNLSDLLGTAIGTGVSGAILAAGLRTGASIGGALLPAFAVGAIATAVGFVLSGRVRGAAAA